MTALRGFSFCLALAGALSSCGGTAPCTPSMCPSGCCDASGQCQPAAPETCGLQGAACVACTPGQTCRLGACAALPGLDGGADGGSPSDAGGTDAGPSDAGCGGACAVTALQLVLRGQQGAFDRAQHGVEGADGLYVEAHFGGDPACPTASSPTPARTLVIAGLRVGDGGVRTEADGLRVTLLDFQGSVSSLPFERATSARATPRFVDRGGLVSFTLEATFDGGTLQGGFAAPHCASLDGP